MKGSICQNSLNSTLKIGIFYHINHTALKFLLRKSIRKPVRQLLTLLPTLRVKKVKSKVSSMKKKGLKKLFGAVYSNLPKN